MHIIKPRFWDGHMKDSAILLMTRRTILLNCNFANQFTNTYSMNK